MTYRITIERMSPTGVLVDARAEADEAVVQELLARVARERLPGGEELEHALSWALHAEAESVPGRTYGPEGAV